MKKAIIIACALFALAGAVHLDAAKKHKKKHKKDKNKQQRTEKRASSCGCGF